MTREQRAVIELRTERNHLVLGPPGSGKTQVLLHRAIWLKNSIGCSNDDFVVLVYTNVLSYFLKHSLEFLGIPQENVRTFDDWCGDLWDKFIKGPKPRTDPDRRGRTYINFPAIRKRVLTHLEIHHSVMPRLEFIMIDEGQDLDVSSYGILKRCSKHLTVFADARQQIFEGGAQVEEMLQQINATGQSASLLPAFRNSPDIAKLASYFGNQFEGLNYLAKERQKPTLYYAKDWDNEIDHLADVLRERRLQNHKCGIIVPTNLDLHSVAGKLKDRGIEVHKAVPPRKGGTAPDFDSLVPVIASYHSAKGLTFDCVLLPKLVENNFRNVSPDYRKRMLLVGITRATQWTYLSSVEGYEMDQIKILLAAAENGDLFIKRGDTTRPEAPDNNTETEDEGISFL